MSLRKTAVFFGIVSSLLQVQSSFASAQTSDDSATQTTIQHSDSFHNGELYRSFSLCQNGNCEQLGPASEYPVNWLVQQAALFEKNSRGLDLASGVMTVGTVIELLVPGFQPAAFVSNAATFEMLDVAEADSKKAAAADTAITNDNGALVIDKKSDQVKYLEAVLNNYGQSSGRAEASAL